MSSSTRALRLTSRTCRPKALSHCIVASRFVDRCGREKDQRAPLRSLVRSFVSSRTLCLACRVPSTRFPCVPKLSRLPRPSVLVLARRQGLARRTAPPCTASAASARASSEQPRRGGGERTTSTASSADCELRRRAGGRERERERETWHRRYCYNVGGEQKSPSVRVGSGARGVRTSLSPSCEARRGEAQAPGQHCLSCPH